MNGWTSSPAHEHISWLNLQCLAPHCYAVCCLGLSPYLAGNTVFQSSRNLTQLYGNSYCRKTWDKTGEILQTWNEPTIWRGTQTATWKMLTDSFSGCCDGDFWSSGIRRCVVCLVLPNVSEDSGAFITLTISDEMTQSQKPEDLSP